MKKFIFMSLITPAGPNFLTSSRIIAEKNHILPEFTAIPWSKNYVLIIVEEEGFIIIKKLIKIIRGKAKAR